ncbi:hypothetical protein DPEC_G00077320 [Dallia pectoralis]|uniref:Uncharacterized protein n=1 Tax=Dallia pectoralis TaxID=75939 RepID=A0ACC2H458_DALPE|nr:hypothetical protein DPEC_G00077320 [Dallia pectoralis]
MQEPTVTISVENQSKQRVPELPESRDAYSTSGIGSPHWHGHFWLQLDCVLSESDTGDCVGGMLLFSPHCPHGPRVLAWRGLSTDRRGAEEQSGGLSNSESGTKECTHAGCVRGVNSLDTTASPHATAGYQNHK